VDVATTNLSSGAAPLPGGALSVPDRRGGRSVPGGRGSALGPPALLSGLLLLSQALPGGLHPEGGRGAGGELGCGGGGGLARAGPDAAREGGRLLWGEREEAARGGTALGGGGEALCGGGVGVSPGAFARGHAAVLVWRLLPLNW